MKSFSIRLTRTITIIFLVIMILISLLASIVTTTGVYSSYKEHFVDAIGNISRNITANLEKVEISGEKGQGIYSFILGPHGEYIAHPDMERYLGAWLSTSDSAFLTHWPTN